jgi:hypothetical protein
VCIKLANVLLENAIRLKDPKIRIEYTEAFNYIILAAITILHKLRVKFLKHAYLKFQEALKCINKGKQPHSNKACDFIDKVLKPLTQYRKDTIQNFWGQFKLDTLRCPYQHASNSLKSQIGAEEEMDKYLLIKKEIKDTIIGTLRDRQKTTTWAKSFKEYNTKREFKEWRTYFLVKKECNRIKFQAKEEKIKKCTKIGGRSSSLPNPVFVIARV